MSELIKFIFVGIIIFNFGISVLSEIPRPRGVSISRASLYTPADTFTCLDGLKTIKYSQVNDDYCDCDDSSDEPGTSACPTGTFHCTNLGYRSKNIPSSQVNDGICDCCDTSDEYGSTALCLNNCNELGRDERDREKIRIELAKKGNLLKTELVTKGKSLKSERVTRLTELEAKKKEAEVLREGKESKKKQAEEFENEALQVYREIQENQKREKLELEAAENRKEAEQTFIKYDSDNNGMIDIAELQTRIAFDKDRDGVVSTEEAKFFLDENEQVDRETFVTLSWPKIKPYLMLDSGLFKPPESEKTNEDIETHDEEVDDVDQSDYTEEHTDEESQTTEEAEEHEEEEDATEDTQDINQTPEYDPETQKLIEDANSARNDYSTADRTVREIEQEIKELKELSEKDYGPEEEFAPLDGECYSYEDREYLYKLCPFDRASQQPRAGGSETRLGTWERWTGSPNKYSVMLYSNGASCWNGPQRSATVALECGLEHSLTSVTEPNRCEYYFTFQTPASCQLSDESADVHDEL